MGGTACKSYGGEEEAVSSSQVAPKWDKVGNAVGLERLLCV